MSLPLTLDMLQFTFKRHFHNKNTTRYNAIQHKTYFPAVKPKGFSSFLGHVDILMVRQYGRLVHFEPAS